MELRVLRYFWTIAEEKNISKAAKLLHITQPTLSRQLRELEEELGTPLFIREKNQLTLTQDGLFLKERAEEILTLSDNTARAFLDKKTEMLSGSFSIGCVEADNSDTLAMMLEELVSDYPQVRFNLFSGMSDDIIDKLEKGILDLAILLEPVAADNYEKLVLPREERWGLLVSKDSCLSQKEAIRPSDIRGIPLLCSSRPEVQLLLSHWAGVPLEKLNIAGNFNLIFNVFALVENRVGSAVTIEGAVSNRRLENLVFVPLEPELKTHCVLVWKKNRLQTPIVNELIKRFHHAFQA